MWFQKSTSTKDNVIKDFQVLYFVCKKRIYNYDICFNMFVSKTTDILIALVFRLHVAKKVETGNDGCATLSSDDHDITAVFLQ
jgi:hypothetical protein